MKSNDGRSPETGINSPEILKNPLTKLISEKSPTPTHSSSNPLPTSSGLKPPQNPKLEEELEVEAETAEEENVVDVEELVITPLAALHPPIQKA